MNTIPITEETRKNLLGLISETKIKELQSKGYDMNEIYNSLVKMELNEGTYEEQLKKLEEKKEKDLKKYVIKKNRLKASYVQKDPQLQMDLKTKELYYYDKYICKLVIVEDFEKI